MFKNQGLEFFLNLYKVKICVHILRREKMIEKIMKAVKSGNKKRGKNITIRAVVGMLLSCTAVLGGDVSGLEIT